MEKSLRARPGDAPVSEDDKDREIQILTFEIQLAQVLEIICIASLASSPRPLPLVNYLVKKRAWYRLLAHALACRATKQEQPVMKPIMDVAFAGVLLRAWANYQTGNRDHSPYL